MARRWAPGSSYGPVLSPTDLYLLEGKLELHPILLNKCADFHLDFDMVTGQTGDFSKELQFTMKDEAATLPRMTELIIIARRSLWCTIVRKDIGVTIGDVCDALWNDYSMTPLTDAEFNTLSQREQDKVRRIAYSREKGAIGGLGGWGSGSTANYPVSACKRVDWLRGRTMFDGLESDGEYVKKRLGFSAPNIFVLDVTD